MILKHTNGRTIIIIILCNCNYHKNKPKRSILCMFYSVDVSVQRWVKRSDPAVTWFKLIEENICNGADSCLERMILVTHFVLCRQVISLSLDSLLKGHVMRSKVSTIRAVFQNEKCILAVYQTNSVIRCASREWSSSNYDEKFF